MLKCNEKLIVNVIIRDEGVSAFCNIPQYVATHLSSKTGYSYTVISGTRYIHQVSKQGATEKEAINNLIQFFKANLVTGVMKKGSVINRTSAYMNQVVEYKTSGIPGDSYSVAVKRNSSMRDKCRSLCD